jgi:hypothetical protein
MILPTPYQPPFQPPTNPYQRGCPNIPPIPPSALGHPTPG